MEEYQSYRKKTPHLYECEAADYLYVLPGCLGYRASLRWLGSNQIGCFTTLRFLPLRHPVGRKKLLSAGYAAFKKTITKPRQLSIHRVKCGVADVNK